MTSFENEIRSRVEKSIGAFVVVFGKLEYALTSVIIQLNRIVDGTTIQPKFPYGFDEMCRFLQKADKDFLDVDQAPLKMVADQLIELNDVRTVIVHSYLSEFRHKTDGLWLTFDRFASIPGQKNGRRLVSFKVKHQFIDDACADLSIARSRLIQIREALEALPAR
jgi:hypothetical protein